MTAPAPSGSARERLSFNRDWRFTRGDPADAGDALAYGKIRAWMLATGRDLCDAPADTAAPPAGEPAGDISYLRPEFDDRGWRALELPHDWGIEGPFAQELPGETGKLPWAGVGWYRKRFTLPKRDAGRRIQLEFDGAMSFAAVWVNGRFAGGWPYGYTTFRVDITNLVVVGAENVVVVRLDNPPDSSRWYPGGGLYRNVWLHKTGPVAIAPWGVYVTTPRVSAREALVNVDVTLTNHTESKSALAITTRIFALRPDGTRATRPVAVSAPEELELDPARSCEAMRSNLLRLPRPKLWDVAHPHRYVAVTTVTQRGRVLDEVMTNFGVRTIAFPADDGFHLNGRRVAIQGVCLHHDLGALGAAFNVAALERQLDLLQAMGCNAIRTAHNPPAPELLEACDRRGLLVLDEAFDCWRRGKKRPPGVPELEPADRYFDYARVFDDWHERDLRAMVRRDRNHPCVIAWSIGNEVIENWLDDGWKVARRLAGIVREEDRTRPTTMGCNNPRAGYLGFASAVDLIGFNYKPWEYAPFHARHPTVPVFGSETASVTSSRGEYFFPVLPDDKAHGRVDFQVSSYDLSCPEWALPADVEFRGLDENPFTAGEFVWTGFDYLGEPTPYNSDATNLLNYSNPADRDRAARDLAELGRVRVPSRSSYFGILDLAGFPKDRFHLYQARWRPQLRMAHILPHWNWPERVGQVTPVHVYSSGDEAELFLNGRSLGRRKRGGCVHRFCWDDVVYAPGELRVVVWKRGRRWATAARRTTGAATRLDLVAHRKLLRADGTDLAFVTVRIADRAGSVVPRSRNQISFTLRGPGDLIAVDNGDATSFEPFQAQQRTAFNGLALAVVRARRGRGGAIVLRAEARGLKRAEIVLRSRRP